MSTTMHTAVTTVAPDLNVWLRSTIFLLLELESIADALDTVERQHGRHALIDDARGRQGRARSAVLSQLAQLVTAADTIH
jgi:hypothetical protein